MGGHRNPRKKTGRCGENVHTPHGHWLWLGIDFFLISVKTILNKTLFEDLMYLKCGGQTKPLISHYKGPIDSSENLNIFKQKKIERKAYIEPHSHLSSKQLGWNGMRMM